MSTEKAYVSATEAPMKLWRECAVVWDEWRERMTAFEKEIGAKPVMQHGFFDGSYVVVGVAVVDPVPAGFTKLARNDYLTPNRRSKAGAEAGKVLHRLHGPSTLSRFETEFGVPVGHLAGNRLLTPGVFAHEDRLWVSYAADPSWDGGDAFTEVKLSEYYAAKEAHDAAASTDGVQK